MTSQPTGWVALAGQIWGTPEDWHMAWNWDYKYHATKDQARKAGFGLAGSDDFNLGHVIKGELVWFGWMDQKHPDEDYAEVATYFGWRTRDAA